MKPPWEKDIEKEVTVNKEKEKEKDVDRCGRRTGVYVSSRETSLTKERRVRRVATNQKKS